MSTKSPTVSIIIPSYNRGYCIARAITSVLRQTYTDFEIIVVDDASTDDTQQQVKCFTDARIYYLSHVSNRGGGAARNTGIQAARGEFIAFLDSDDSWQTYKLQRQIHALQQLGPTWGMSYTWLACVNEQGEVTQRRQSELEGNCFLDMLAANFIGSFSNVVVRKTLLQKTGGLDETLRSCQDWDLFIRLSRQTRIHCLPECAVNYLESVSDKYRISSNPRAVIQGHRRILEKYADDYAALPAAYQQRASHCFMQVFASVGNLSGAFSSGVLRLRYGFSLNNLADSVHLILRATRRFFQYKLRALQRA